MSKGHDFQAPGVITLMRWLMRTVSILFLPAMPTAAPQHPPARPEAIRVESERVLLDVLVFDRDGKFVSGLSPEDFVVTEGGRERPVTNLIAVDSSAAPSGPSDATAVSVRDENRIVVILDRVSTDPGEYARAVDAADYLAERLPGRAKMAILVYDGRMRFVQGFTRDRRLLQEALAKSARALPVRTLPRREEIMEEIASLFSERLALGFQITDTTSLQAVVREAVTDAVRSANRHLAFSEMQLSGFFGAMRNLVEALGHVPGSKHVYFFSRGYGLRQGEDLADLLRDNIEGRIGNLDPAVQRNLMMQATQVTVLDYHARMSELVGLSNSRRVRFYGIDPSGLQALLPGGRVTGNASLYQILNLPDRRLGRDSRSLSEPIDSLALLARETNGLALYHRNDLKAAVDQILAHQSRYYLLGYEPAPDRKPGKFYRVRVRLRRPGKYRVLAKRGYLYQDPAKVRSRLDYVLAYPGLFREIPFEVTLATFREPEGDTTTLSLEIPGREMPWIAWQDNRRASLEVAGVFLDPKGRTVAQFRRPFEIFLPMEQFQGYREKSFIFYHEVRLPPGNYQLRAVVSERERGDIGAARKDFVVQRPTGKLELSDLVLTQDIRPAAPGRRGPMFVGEYRVVPEGDSMVRLGEPVYVYFQVYNLTRRSGCPQGTVRYQLEDEAGAVLHAGDLPIRRFNLPQAVAVSQPVPLVNSAAGGQSYRFRVQVEDQVSGQSASAEIEIRPDS